MKNAHFRLCILFQNCYVSAHASCLLETKIQKDFSTSPSLTSKLKPNPLRKKLKRNTGNGKAGI